MRSAARELGTAKVSTSSVRLIARTPWNHNPHVFGASWERRAVAPCSQISAAVTPRSNSTGASTGVEKVPLRATGSSQPTDGFGLSRSGKFASEAVALARSSNVAPGFLGKQGSRVVTRPGRPAPALRLFHASPYTRWFARLLRPPTSGLAGGPSRGGHA